MRIDRHRIDPLAIEGRRNAKRFVNRVCQQAIIESGTVAEPVSGAVKGEARHQHHIDITDVHQRRVTARLENSPDTIDQIGAAIDPMQLEGFCDFVEAVEFDESEFNIAKI